MSVKAIQTKEGSNLWMVTPTKISYGFVEAGYCLMYEWLVSLLSFGLSHHLGWSVGML